ncbi:MAG TPA: vitamin B12 dependent-methionine synthase activation domain-containing protein, partial [Flavobacteriales bacterium]|nr:vitamin B12 dependent-methionine synthase activation domain-containing protein [Flavobacteriales bacterium]
LLNAEQIGVSLTENMAMYPNATVSGYYFSYPESKYFSVGKIQNDQVENYSKRKEQTIEETKKWLRQNI